MSNDPIALWTLAFTVIGVVIAGGGVVYAIKTLRAGVESLRLAALAQEESTVIARAQFWVLVRGVLASYHDVHANLRPEGIWAPQLAEKYASRGPQDAAEWARVELYMGMFEYCEKLMGRGLLEEKDFAASYQYRIENLLQNAVIVKEKLHIRGAHWGEFYNLCKRLRIDIPSPSWPDRSAPDV